MVCSAWVPVIGGAAQALAAANIPVVSSQKVAVTDKDLTNQALAMKGADLVVTALTPAQVPTLVNTLKHNGMSPQLFGSSVVAAMPKGSLATSLLPQVSGVVDCLPTSQSAPPNVKSWATKFQAQFGFAPDFFGAESYDSVMLTAQAIKAAGSTDHGKVADALRTMAEYQGICSVYKANDQQILNQQSILATYDAAGVLQVGDTVTVK
jgi:ABC-type branched-subunit amino acid transport system substrate-binding protein